MTQTSIKHQLNKRKLSKQQKAGAIYMTFYFYHDTDRGDIKSNSVRVGLQEAVSNLHGADVK